MFCPLSAGISDTPVPSVVVDDKGTSEQAEHEAFHQAQISQLNALPPSEWFKKLSSYSSDAHSKLDLTQDTFDILSYLAFHYGFIPSLLLWSESPVALRD